MCYYLKLKFRNINNRIKTFSIHKRNDRKLKSILYDYHGVCAEVNRYDNFWNYYMLIEYSITAATICFIIYIAFFPSFNLWIKIIFIVYFPVFMLNLTIVSLSASMVTKEVTSFIFHLE